MEDLRKFRVEVDKEVVKILPIMEARKLGTFHKMAGKKVRLINDETGRRFKWWPELG